MQNHLHASANATVTRVLGDRLGRKSARFTACSGAHATWTSLKYCLHPGQLIPPAEDAASFTPSSNLHASNMRLLLGMDVDFGIKYDIVPLTFQSNLGEFIDSVTIQL